MNTQTFVFILTTWKKFNVWDIILIYKCNISDVTYSYTLYKALYLNTYYICTYSEILYSSIYICIYVCV